MTQPEYIHESYSPTLAGHGGAGAGEGLSRHYGARGRPCRGGALEWTLEGYVAPTWSSNTDRLLELVRDVTVNHQAMQFEGAVMSI